MDAKRPPPDRGGSSSGWFGRGARSARGRRARPGGASAPGRAAPDGPGPAHGQWAGPTGGRSGPSPPRGRGDYFQEASANCSWVSGLTLGGLTFAEKAMDGGELEMGSPGRMSMIWLFRSW